MSEFNFRIGFNSDLNEKKVESCITPCCFKKYGKVLKTRNNYEESEMLSLQQEASITEVPKLFSFVIFAGYELIPTEIHIKDVQKIIRSELNRLVPTFNKLAQEEIEESKKSRVLGTPHRQDLIENIHYKNNNPFQWYVEIVHRNPPQLAGVGDDVYQFFLKDTKLYVNMGIYIYYTEEEGSKVYHIYVSRCSGRSPALRDFYQNLKGALERADKLHNFLKEKK